MKYKNWRPNLGLSSRKEVDSHLSKLDTTGVSRRELLQLISAGVAATAGASVLGSPGIALASTSGKLAFLSMTSSNEYCVQSSQAIEAAAKALGFSGYSFIDGQFDSARMLNQAQTEASSGTSAVILFAPDGSNLRRIADLAGENKMYFANVWAHLPWYTPFDANQYYGFYAVPDEFTAHRAVTAELLTQVKSRWGGGEIIGITGIPGYSTDIVRSRGRDDALKQFPEIKLVGELPGNWNREDSVNATQDLLARNPNIRGVVAQNDDIAQGVLAALRTNGLRAGEDVLVVGADGTSGAVRAIADGSQLATSANSPAFMGGLFTSHLYDLVNGWQPRAGERMMHWRSVTLTKDNVGAYIERYVDNGEVAPFDYAKMSKVAHPEDWDPQNEVFPMDIDYEFMGMEKPADFAYPEEYTKGKDQWEEIAAEYKAHYKTPFLGPSPMK